jgi:AAA ATPase domain/AAA domain, putative AbiEii toxin, Type IV TA system
MYIQSIEIQNLKRLDDFKLKFTSNGGTPRMWSVLIGENGTGKSSILQAIALAAAGRLLVNSLAGSSVAHLVDRRQTDEMKVTACFSIPSVDQAVASVAPKRRRTKAALPPPAVGRKLISEVTLRQSQSTLRANSKFDDESVSVTGEDPLDEARAQELPGWFVVGYGVNRTLPNSASSVKLVRPTVDRMRPLFEPTQQLISTDFITAFENPEVKRLYSRILQSVLIDTEVLPKDIAAFELRGRSGITLASDLLESARFSQTMANSTVKVPSVALAHGYQSTIAWIADLIGHIVWEAQRAGKTEVDFKSFEGLVLIDEIDLYLHPTWQAKLIPALRENFPRVQFIATTHSPVVLATLVPDEVVRLHVDVATGSVRRVAPHEDSGEWGSVRSDADLDAQPDPRSMTGTEMYQEYFGVERLTLNEQGEDIRDYTAIATNPYRNDYQEQRMKELTTRLKSAGVGDLVAPVDRSAQTVEP